MRVRDDDIAPAHTPPAHTLRASQAGCPVHTGSLYGSQADGGNLPGSGFAERSRRLRHDKREATNLFHSPRRVAGEPNGPGAAGGVAAAACAQVT